MYLVDTNVISEYRKGRRANRGVVAFFEDAEAEDQPIYLSVVTMGELRRGVELKRFRGDQQQCEVPSLATLSFCRHLLILMIHVLMSEVIEI